MELITLRTDCRSASQPIQRHAPKAGGFTLVELMIVIVIISILAGVAVPSYLNSIQRSKRGDAKTALLNVQMLQEKYRTNNTSYGTLAQIGANAASPEGYYTIAVVGVPGSSSYNVTAAPAAGGDMVGDSCGTFAIDENGQDYTSGYAGADCWDR